jgi:NitT/TauT family transport system ATP-binding protein
MLPKIIIKNIKKQLNNVDIFVDFNLEIPANAVTVILGPNGCGKSTLLNILSGLIPVNSGQYYIKNFNPYHFSYLMQDYRATLMPWLKNLDNILLPLRLQKQHTMAIQHKINFLKQIIPVDLNLDSHPYKLSGGQQQIVALLRALITNPDLLFIDEPLSALDQENTYKFRQILLNYQKENNATIVMVSHNIDDALLLADNIIILSAKPTMVIKNINNNLPKPRAVKMLVLPAFNELRNQILSVSEYKI